jgi:hypothetical protein
MSSPPSPEELAWLKELREHAWTWFSMHAQQRMQTLNYFLIAMAFLATAYGASVAKTPPVASAVAFTGFLVSAAFNRLDFRNRELVKHGEAALRKVEERYEQLTQWPEVRLVDRAEKPRVAFLGTFRWSILFIETILAAAFLVGAFYALSRI